MSDTSDQIGLRDALSIGIGGMVGGGIFAVLGLAADLAKGGTPVSFLFAGLIAALTAWSYAKLSRAFPDSGGTVKFINEGFGTGLFSGGMNNLLWISYIIMLSLYASAFGSYAPNLYSLTGNHTLDFHIYASAVILFATAINYYSVKIVGRIESAAVIIKLLILLAFVGIGLLTLKGNPSLSQLSPANWENPFSLVVAGMIIFVAYEGFELIANAAPDLKDPEKNIPRAYMGSVLFVIALYVVIAIITVGSLPFPQIAEAKDYVLAEAAKPMLGQAGFTIITIAALISTFSAINASLYGGSRVSYEIAEDDELPHEFTARFGNQPIGLAVTAGLTLLSVNTLKLESISSTGSIGFLAIFAVVNTVAIKKASEIKSTPVIPAIAAALCGAALLALVSHKALSQQWLDLTIAAGVIITCFGVEFVYKRRRK